MGVVSLFTGARAASAQRRASEQAAAAQLQASNQANQTTRDSLGVNAMLQDPFRQGGMTAYNQYLQMMGMAPVQTNNTADVLSQYGFGSGGVAGSQGGYPNSGQGANGGFGAQSGGMTPQGAQGGFNAQQVLDTIRATPGYQFGLDQGNRGIQASAAARGGLNSGAAMRSLFRYGNDYADQQGYSPYMNRLAGLFGGAQSISQNVGNSALDAGRTIGGNQINAGNARANMYTRNGDISAQRWGGIGSIFNNSAGQAIGSIFGGG